MFVNLTVMCHLINQFGFCITQRQPNIHNNNNNNLSLPKQQYPVALIDMLNDRMRCNDPSPASGMTVTLLLKPASVRLHLVDFHRELFYERIEQYDLFVYTEDDIRISPKTIAAYLHETNRVSALVGPAHSSDYNVGIVRYEYNFPENVVITDKTRHATENVTRVYWEHLGKPIFEKAVDKVEHEELGKLYVSMHLHHQGMYMATRELLKAWKERKGCNFDVVKNRPGSGSQPSEGTQRVWMSSQQLFAVSTSSFVYVMCYVQFNNS